MTERLTEGRCAIRHRSTLVRLFIVGLVAAALLAAAPPASAYWFLPETRLVSDPASQAGCDVSGAKVVYSDGRHGHYDVFLYDLTTGIETRLTKNTAGQTDPVISGTWVAYADDRNGSASDYSTYTKYKASLSLPYSGKWRIRAWHPADDQNASTRTMWREFTVR